MRFRALLTTYAPQQIDLNNQPSKSKNVKEQRADMAQTHAQMVEALAAAVGHDKAVALGRESLFAVGVELGKANSKANWASAKTQTT